MRIIWHIVKKDLRRFRWDILALVALLSIKVMALTYMQSRIEANHVIYANSKAYDILKYMPYNSFLSIYGLTDLMDDAFSAFKPLVFVCLLILDDILVLYIIINALKEDSAFEIQSFWRSRPATRGQMLAAKALFIGIVAFALPSLAQTAYSGLSLLNPLPPNRLYFFSNQIQCLAIQADWVALAVVLATLWRSQIVGGLVIGAMGFAISFFYTEFGSGGRGFLLVSDTLMNLVHCGALIIAVAMYLRGNRKIGFGLLGALVTVILSMGYLS